MTLVLLLATPPDALTTYPKLGSGILTGVASGGDIFTDPETGTGFSDRTGRAADAVTTPETGMVVTAKTGGAADAVTTPETGTVINDREVTLTSRPYVMVFGEAGSSFAERVALGPDAMVNAETGTALSTREASGPAVRVFGETGAGVSARTGQGVEVYSPASVGLRAGAGVTAKVASGSDATTFVESGFRGRFPSPYLYPSPNIYPARPGAVTRTASATRQLAPKIKEGSATSDRMVLESDSFTFGERETVISERAGSGVRAMVYGESGAGVETRTTGGSVFTPTALMTSSASPSVLIETTATATDSVGIAESEGLLMTVGASDE